MKSVICLAERIEILGRLFCTAFARDFADFISLHLGHMKTRSERCRSKYLCSSFQSLWHLVVTWQTAVGRAQSRPESLRGA